MIAKSLFSFIELLIVISIVMLLASLLSPSLNRLVKQNRKLECLNNLKSVYSVTSYYSSDHHDFLPYRSIVNQPHNFRVVHSYDFNKSLIKAYGADRNKFFCQGELLNVRNPNHPLYTYNNITYQYFNDANTSGKWIAEKPNYSRMLSGYKKQYPLWGCLTLKINASDLWFGHDEPIINIQSEGINSVQIDGSAQWFDFFEMERFFITGDQTYYWPKL